jgi:hypothetical protein
MKSHTKIYLVVNTFLVIMFSAVCVRVLNSNTNSVFAPENYTKNNPSARQVTNSTEVGNSTTGNTNSTSTTTNSTKNNSTSGDVWSTNFDCPEGQVFNPMFGKCLENSINATEVMFANFSTSTKIAGVYTNEFTKPEMVPCVGGNKTSKYVNRKQNEYENYHSAKIVQK